jgi:DNA-binding NtrC family response regulator
MADGLLFGYERGAFSGAVQRHRGHVECADEGTLFLDELLSLSIESQAKLLRALDTGEVQRLGEETERYADLRVVGAVQGDVEECITGGALRRDLCQRLAGVVIELPPLVERPEDVLPLARHFAEERGQTLEPGAAEVLVRHSWLGNVRELRQVIDRAGCLVKNGTLPPAALREAIALGAPASRRSGGTITRAALVSLAETCGWNAESLAAARGLSRTTFFRELRRAGLTLRGARKYQTYANVRVRMERSAAPTTATDR